MMRLPHFTYRAPKSVAEAASMLASGPGEAMLIAGGTDVLPNMKRRQQTPKTLIGLRNISELQTLTNGDGLCIGAGVTLTALVRDARVRIHYPGLWQAVAQIATPHLRNMGTLGGNICLDTRCNYYDQNYEWRKAIDFCMKKDGQTCWVATSSPKCLAVSSTDSAPALLALDARVRLVSAGGAREVAIADLYQNDGINYLTRRPDEILTTVVLPDPKGRKSCYWKLRRRGSFDFPVLGVAASARFEGDTVVNINIVLGAVASRPLLASKAAAALLGHRLTDENIATAAGIASDAAKPMDNTDFTLGWRKRVVREFVTLALRDLRGDDVRAERYRYALQSLEAVG
ncbi:MAG: FAD binding domain-containing protein [Planctomycetes bacterium]|nr:FAD binding domain-containing protein [Planctomycetota bacterium]